MTAFPLTVEKLICIEALATQVILYTLSQFASSPPPSFVGIVSSGFNILKIPTLLAHAGLFGCFHNPTNSDMNDRSFKVRM